MVRAFGAACRALSRIRPARPDRVLEALEDGVCLLDNQGRITQVNEPLCQWVGRNREALLGADGAGILTDPEDQRSLRDAIGEVLAHGGKATPDLAISAGKPARVSVVGLAHRGSCRAILTLRTHPSPEAHRRVQDLERRFRALIEHTSDLVLVVDAGGRILYRSPAVLRYFQSATGEPLPENLFARIHPEDRGKVQAAFQAALAGPGAEGETEARVVLQDGTIRTVDARATNRTDDPAIGGIVVYGREVTAQRVASATLRKFYRVVEQSPASIVITDLRGNMEYVNPAFTALTGYPAAEAIGRSTRILKSGAMDPAVYSELWETISRGEEWRGELHNRRKDGSFFWESAIIGPLQDEDGHITHYIAVKQDITIQKESEAEIRRLGARNRAILDSTQEGIFGLDRSGALTFVNAAGLAMLGYDADDLKAGVHHADIHHHPDPVSSEACEMATTLRTGARYQEVVDRFFRKDGLGFWAEFSSAPMDLQGDEAGAVVVFQDITERLKREESLIHLQAELEVRSWEMRDARDQAVEASKTRTRFLASLSHELLTPMNAILGMTQLLAKGPLTMEQKERADTIQTSGEGLVQLIRDLLDFSRLEEGRMTLEAVPFETWRLFEDSATLVAGSAEAKGLELACCLDPALPPLLIGDPFRLRQVLTNLLGNAVKFTQRGAIGLRVRVQAHRPERVRLRIEVEDTGVGIPPERQHDLFQPFTQAERGTTRRFGGTGLGLAICRQLVDLMEGRIGLASEPGQGSLFWVELPFAPVDPYQPWPHSPELAGRRVQLALASGLTRESLEGCLASLGMQVVGPADATDVVILDESSARPAGLSSPVPRVGIVGAGGDSKGTVEGVLRRPIRRGILKRVLEAVLSGRAAQDPLPAETRKGEASGAPASAAWRGRRVLIVDDNEVNRKLLRYLIEEEGLVASEAIDGQDALDQLRKAPCDLVLMDWQMPTLDGREATRRYREREAPGSRLPIVAVTANLLPEDRVLLTEAGMDDFLAKPIQQDSLQRVLHRWLSPGGVESTETWPGREGSGNAPEAVEPLLDENVAARLREIPTPEGGRLMAKVCRLFLRDFEPRLAAIAQAVEEDDMEALMKSAHALKGSAASLGLAELAARCRELERAGREGEPAQAREAHRRLNEAARRAALVLEAEAGEP